MSTAQNNPQYSTCRICHSSIVRYDRGAWYHTSGHTSPPYPGHYAEPDMQAVFTPEVFARTVQAMTGHMGLVGELP